MAPGHRDWFGLPVADGFRHAQGASAWGRSRVATWPQARRTWPPYLRMYLNGGMGGDGARVLSADSVRRMFLDRVPDPEGDTYYGMGWTSFSWDDGGACCRTTGRWRTTWPACACPSAASAWRR